MSLSKIYIYILFTLLTTSCFTNENSFFVSNETILLKYAGDPARDGCGWWAEWRSETFFLVNASDYRAEIEEMFSLDINFYNNPNDTINSFPTIASFYVSDLGGKTRCAWGEVTMKSIELVDLQ